MGRTAAAQEQRQGHISTQGRQYLKLEVHNSRRPFDRLTVYSASVARVWRYINSIIIIIIIIIRGRIKEQPR